MPVDYQALNDSPHLLDLLIKMEDVLDTLDIYVGVNWIDGVVVEGPKVRRYWLDMTLQYEKMPDPRIALRLLKHGIRVNFTNLAKSGDGDEGEEESGETGWLVSISIPRRLIVEITSDELDFYDEDIDSDDVVDAQDTGVDDESAVMDGGDLLGMDDEMMGDEIGDEFADDDIDQGGPAR